MPLNFYLGGGHFVFHLTEEETAQRGEGLAWNNTSRTSRLSPVKPTVSHTPSPAGHRPARWWASPVRWLLHHVQPLLGAVELAYTTWTNSVSKSQETRWPQRHVQENVRSGYVGKHDIATISDVVSRESNSGFHYLQIVLVLKNLAQGPSTLWNCPCSLAPRGSPSSQCTYKL